MAKLVSDVLDECSRMLVNHQSWAYLDCMPTAEQLDVIQNYSNDPREQKNKYIVVVFKRDEMAERHFKRCKELGLNEIDESDQGFNKEEMEEEWLENNP